MSNFNDRNVSAVYQMSHPPRLYLQINGPRGSGAEEAVLCGRIDGDAETAVVDYFANPFVVDGRDATRGSTAGHLQGFAYHRGPGTSRKNGYWVSKRALKTPQTNTTSPVVSECDSDDSGRSSSNSVLNNNDRVKNDNRASNISKSMDSLPINRVNLTGQHYQLHIGHIVNSNPRFSSYQQSNFFCNKRRHPMHRNVAPTRGMPSARNHFNNQQYHHPHCIAPDRFLMKAHLMQVKETPANLTTGSKWDSLSQDIWNKFMSSQQTEDTFKKKMKFWRFLYTSIKDAFPRYSLYLVGSTVSGFGANSSDMDLCLLVKQQEPGDCRFQALQHLNTIYHFIQSQGVLFRAELIHAKVPILKFCDNNFFLEVDLNCNNIVGIKNTHLLYCYSQLDWRVRPLVLIVKLWARYNNINDAKNKTISSYSYVLMVLHYLQCGTNPQVIPCLQKEFPEKFSNDVSIYNIDLLEEMPKYRSKNNQTLGELLFGFFQYFNSFDYSKFAISVREGKLLSIDDCRIAHRNEPHQWKFLCVEEPYDLSNTARSVYDPDVFLHIRNIFEKSKCALEKSQSLSSILQTYKMH